MKSKMTPCLNPLPEVRFFSRIRRCRLLALSLVLLSSLLSVSAAEYFTNKGGNDGSDGRTDKTAFATIQKGVGTLAPGDVLTIGPGEYEENVLLSDFGDPEKETLIRAAIPGTVLIRGDRDVEGRFQKVEGKKFTRSVDWSEDVLSVYEADTMRILSRSTGLDALEFGPGKFYWDAEKKKLFLSSSDLQAPDQHRYRVGVLRGNGLELRGVQKVVLEGLAASGFSTPVKEEVLLQPPSGFCLRNSKHCIVRNCTGFANRSGIIINEEGERGSVSSEDQSQGNSNLIEGCTAYGNGLDGITIYSPDTDNIRDSRAFLNRTYGFRFYGVLRGDGVCLMSGLVAWGNPGGDYWMKGKGLSEGGPKARAERCIALGDAMLRNITHVTTGGGASYQIQNPDSINLPQGTQEYLDFANKEFADALNQDFGLQGNSSLRSAAPDGTDRGPLPFKGNVRYVSPTGNDSSDGLSVKSAWATLSHALGAMKPGETLYLTGGRYSGFPATALRDLRIRARGIDPVVIEGPVLLKGGEAVTFERLQFAGNVRAENGAKITFENCTFRGPAGLDAQKVTDLTVRHGVLAGSLTMKQCANAFLAANLYATSPALGVDSLESISYSDYNSYPAEKNCWKAGSKSLSIADLQARGENHSIVQVPELAEKDGVLKVANLSAFAGRGPLGTAIGHYRPWNPLQMQLAGPSISSMSNSSANIEWWTSLPGEVELAWGDTPECKNREQVSQSAFSSYTLSGLLPGKKYYVKVTPLRIAPATDPARRYSVPEQSPKVVEFTTPTAPDRAPGTFYVAADGSDAKAGTSREAAWKSIQYAADHVRPGDTVQISAGSYPGTVYFRNSGEKGKPITFRAAPGEKVLIDGKGLKVGFVLFDKSHYRFDGLNFEEFEGIEDNVGHAENGAILVKGGADIQVTRCFFTEGWGPGLIIQDCPDVLVQNCVFMHSMQGADFANCRDLRIENNAFISPLISHLSIGNKPEEPAKVANNIFGENTRGKVQIPFLSVRPTDASNNCFYVRWPETERTLFTAGGGVTLPAVAASGVDTRSMIANPQMQGCSGWKQGWGPGSPKNLMDFFTANPEMVVRGIGLQPEAFADFIKPGEWIYNKAWAEKTLAKIAAARELRQAGKDAEALAAFEAASQEPMHDRLKAELLDEAALCAGRLGNYDQALELARKIPVEAVSGHRQMALFIAQGKYSELLNQYDDSKMSSRKFFSHWAFPETEELMGDIYYYRSIALAETGNLDAAAADLKLMIEKDAKLGYTPGVEVIDRAWLRLGDFYRKYRKDDALALEAYNKVIVRNIKFIYRDLMIPKPALLGTSDTLAVATGAATQILTAQGKPEKVREIQASLLIARAEAFAAQNEQEKMLAEFSRAVALGGLLSAGQGEYVTRAGALTGDAAKSLTEAIAESATPLSPTAQKRLLEALANPATKTRALTILIAFAPADSTKALLEKARVQAQKKAVLEKIEPVLVKLRKLADTSKWQELIAEFEGTDFQAWGEPNLAAEALLVRARAHVALKNPELAQRDIEGSLLLRPDSPEAFSVSAENYLSNFQDRDKALAAYQRSHELTGINYGWASCDRALKISVLLEEKGRRDEALAVLTQYDLGKVAGTWHDNFVNRIQLLQNP